MSRSRSAVPEMETQALASEVKAQKEEEDEDEDLWWHPWEIKSECGEMGTMDCYGESGEECWGFYAVLGC